MEHEIQIVLGAFGTVPYGLEKRQAVLENSKNRDFQSILKID